MFHQLVSHNDDLLRLVERGYAVSVDSGYLIVRDIPYLDGQCQVKQGALVTKLVFVDETHVVQSDHQVFFAGDHPCDVAGAPITNLGGGPTSLALGESSADVVVERSFSNKPRTTGKFKDFFDKIESYATIISGPAMELHDVSPYTFGAAHTPSNSVFLFQDTLTSRAEIGHLSERLKDDVIAVIGVGGTGAYVLDFLAKTPVRAIRIFDRDDYHVHNAFRSPGRLDPRELGQPKAKVHGRRYENFRKGITASASLIDGTCKEDLAGVTFAFVCVDKGTARASIFELLIAEGIPFIDVGMGLNKKHGALSGLVRTTYYPPERAKAMRDLDLAALADVGDDAYHTNIQISELNALNACLAVIRFKQLRGFYLDESDYCHMLLGIGDLKLAGESDLG